MVGLVVDGHGDHAALSAKYQGRAYVLKTSGPRGHCVGARALAASAQREIEMLIGLGYRRIGIVTDLESRTYDCEEFRASVEREIGEVSGVELFVACANQMIENWILADIEAVARGTALLRKGIKQKAWEGRHGKNELKRCFKSGHDYNEVKHGKQFFLLVRDSVARRNSRSFSHFITAAGL